MVYTGSRMVSIEIARIASFYSLDRAVILHTLDGQRYALPYTLEKLEQLVPSDTFFRVNRQLLASGASSHLSPQICHCEERSNLRLLGAQTRIASSQSLLAMTKKLP